MAAKKKAVPGNKRTQKSVQRRKDAGLIQIKVWVKDQTDEPAIVVTEADKVRAYAAKQPLTKAVLKDLENGNTK